MSTRAVITGCLLAAAVMLGAGPAFAQSGYRYWSFWQVTDGSWQYSQIGPASQPVADGDVHGWRFGISTADGAVAPQPRTDPTRAFERICGSTAASDGNVRVALVIDPGLADIAPFGEQVPAATAACAVVPTGSTGATALSTVAQLRLSDGFVCGINGYPTSECAVSVDVPSLPATDVGDVLDARAQAVTGTSDPLAPDPLVPDLSGSEPIPLIIGGVVILAGLASAWLIQRRRT